MRIEVIYAEAKFFKSFQEALGKVAREKIYIEMIEAKPFEDVAKFQTKLVTSNMPVYYAIQDEKVVGWVDISVSENPRFGHRGHLGMGIIEGFRENGLGSRLMDSAVKHAKKIGLEKIELQVYTNNPRAIALYKKFGFSEIGKIKNYRKLDGKYFDAIMMEKFL